MERLFITTSGIRKFRHEISKNKNGTHPQRISPTPT